MPEVKGFRAHRYVQSKVGSFDKVITPPFDVISPEERTELMGYSPFNLTHLILPEEKYGLNKYEAAAKDFESFIAQGAIAQDSEDSFYLLEQTFNDQDGVKHVRRGFFGVTKIPEPGVETVLGHERTFITKIQDRLALTRATQANLGAVFALYSDPDGVLHPFLDQMCERTEDMLAHTIDKVTQRIWRVPNDARVTNYLLDKKLYIADGHHRFATAVAYRDEMRAKEKPAGPRPYDYVLMGFVDMDDAGLLVYPAHRVLDPPAGFAADDFLAKLNRWFEVTPSGEDLAHEVRSAKGCAIGLAVKNGGRYLLKLRNIDRVEFLGADRGPAWRELDVAILHRGIIERTLGLPEGAEFVYEHSAQKALDLVDSGQKGLAFILNATLARQIQGCAEAKEPMPQKSTYIYPKLPSGAAINRVC
ncbi:MAG: DUF1015 domain-containing protein [Candidatus Hydrogenedentes bacterium]|nr:DUF1015 domain-containing protein [Candidatus Hydrogenedentota bacterium]